MFLTFRVTDAFARIFINAEWENVSYLQSRKQGHLDFNMKITCPEANYHKTRKKVRALSHSNCGTCNNNLDQ